MEGDMARRITMKPNGCRRLRKKLPALIALVVPDNFLKDGTNVRSEN
jgi:hypothetical protein